MDLVRAAAARASSSPRSWARKRFDPSGFVADRQDARVAGDDFRQRAAIGHDARRTRAQRLRGRVPEALVKRRNRDGCRGCVELEQLATIHVAAKLDAIPHAQRGGDRLTLLLVRRWRPDRNDARTLELGQRTNQELQVLAPLDRADR